MANKYIMAKQQATLKRKESLEAPRKTVYPFN
jgi:hypothetical protein